MFIMCFSFLPQITFHSPVPLSKLRLQMPWFLTSGLSTDVLSDCNFLPDWFPTSSSNFRLTFTQTERVASPVFFPSLSLAYEQTVLPSFACNEMWPRDEMWVELLCHFLGFPSRNMLPLTYWVLSSHISSDWERPRGLCGGEIPKIKIPGTFIWLKHKQKIKH